jgi:membrane protein YqaA with SNARE-associated domain
MNIYFKVFFDTFLSYISLGLHKEILYFISLKFTNQIFCFSIFSFLGFILAISINYIIGLLIKKIAKKQEQNSFINFLYKYSSLIIISSALNPFASQFFSIIYGFLNKKFHKFIFFSFIGRTLFILINLYLLN